MESFVKPESRNIVGRRKRKLEREEQSESSSMAGSSLMDEEHEMTCTQSKEDSTKRKSFLRSSSSKEWVTNSTTEEEDEDTDKSYSEGKLTDGEEGNFPASKWQYVDLKNINIFYCDKPDPLEELMQNVKEDILKKYPDTPEFGKTVQKFTNLTKENLLVSLDLDVIRQSRKHHHPAKVRLEEDILEDIKSNIEKAEEADRDLDHTNLFDRKWFPAVEMFLYTTVSLIKRILYPTEDDETVKQAKELIKRKTKKKMGKDKKLAGRNAEKCEPSESVYQHFCVMFGGLFFLEHREVDKRTFVVGDKIVNSTPDLAYTLARIPEAGNNLQNYTLLFVVEVKVKPIKNVSSDCLEEQVDSGVLGQVGSELFAEAFYSVLYPNSLGIMCMETKLIFVYLKMPREHLTSIRFKQSLKTEGKIHFTKPYDMLKAEDRAEVSEFLYWLGCFQNHGRRSLMSTGGTQRKEQHH